MQRTKRDHIPRGVLYLPFFVGTTVDILQRNGMTELYSDKLLVT